MKKNYICPKVEIVLPHLTKDLAQLEEHSQGDADAKHNGWITEDDEEGQIQSRNLWDD